MKLSILNDEKFDNDSTEIFSMLHVPWKETEKEVWDKVHQKMNVKVIQMKPKAIRWQIAVAAIIILSFSIGTFMRTYTKTYTALAAQHTTNLLPDGSIVELNSGSEISYKPYWWLVNRQVKLKGEAFFEVKKGKTFSVESAIGTTEVLGTSFNVLTRKNRYEVTCVTGKVKVHAMATKHSVILHPSQKASLQESGQFKIEENINTNNTKAWVSNRMVFTSVALIEVFEEIERQYNVEIKVPKDIALKYTGSFNKNEAIDDVLELICRPFELHIEKNNAGQFQIIK